MCLLDIVVKRLFVSLTVWCFFRTFVVYVVVVIDDGVATVVVVVVGCCVGLSLFLEMWGEGVTGCIFILPRLGKTTYQMTLHPNLQRLSPFVYLDFLPLVRKDCVTSKAECRRRTDGSSDNSWRTAERNRR